MAAIVLVTTPVIPGQEDATPIGIVSAEIAFGMNIFKDIATEFRDFFGGRAKSLQGILADSRKTLYEEIRQQARALGADAVLGVDIDFAEFSVSGGMVMMIANGTAVTFSTPVSDEAEENDSRARAAIEIALKSFGSDAPAALKELQGKFEHTRRKAGVDAAISLVAAALLKRVEEVDKRTDAFNSMLNYYSTQREEEERRQQLSGALAAVRNSPDKPTNWEALRKVVAHWASVKKDRFGEIARRGEELQTELFSGEEEARSIRERYASLFDWGKST
jgi:uncharacterized protein YbjQ (UPF0145 family)